MAIFCTPIDIGMPAVVMKKTKPAMPVAKATGMPTTISTTKTTEMSSIARGRSASGDAVGGRAGIDEDAPIAPAPGAMTML